MNRLSAITLALAAVLAATGAQAQATVNARVLAATPVYENVPVQQCAPAGYGGYTNGAGAAIGALLGGLIGSQFGSGSGHAAGAVLGTIGGAFLGNAAEAQQRGHSGGGCDTAYETHLTGYDVTYEYGGRQYQTRTDRAPGRWLQVPVADAYGGGYGAPAQAYPVAPPPVGGYPLPGHPAAGAPVVTAPTGVVGGGAYPHAVPAGAAPAHAAPAYAEQVVRAPAYVTPVGISLSAGGGAGRHGGWGVGVGDAW
ncbi:MAG TPA: glycine zipper 2TM domain-containing protein [Ottowia sp.]|uniref:glycine zipper 2TM domain-containing protein n=1 Tax=Ottowia sp. TaxID=1898956 RepID=UPI002CA7E38D|nr:glycine zipper 2TM domain-containing protein [Ottowia sp.]HMN20854.1 glycine zipper 2TM domain-containing protein [Ottowia sp.]